MGYVFDQQAAERQEAWFRTDAGRESLRLQMDLLLKLLRPRPGERLLDVGCGSGMHMQMFRREGLDVTGLDPSSTMLSMARTRLGNPAALHSGRAEDLPFEDNEFDIVSLITCLEFVDDPEAALAEAFRVARSRVLIGALNSLSLTAWSRRIRGLFKESLYNRARFFSASELTWLIRKLAGPVRINWASVQVLPVGLACRFSSFEARLAGPRNPCGAFLGLVAEVAYTMRADGLPVEQGLKIGRSTVPIPTATTAGPARIHEPPRRRGM